MTTIIYLVELLEVPCTECLARAQEMLSIWVLLLLWVSTWVMLHLRGHLFNNVWRHG